MANYYGNRGNGSSLRHYRTKGSRNGYSKDPNYRPVGQQAQGKIVNGRYVYDTSNTISERGLANGIHSMQKGAQNNWQQKANATAAGYRAVNAYANGRIAKAKLGSGENISLGDKQTINNRADRGVIKNLGRQGAQNNWQQMAATTAARGMTNNRVKSGASGMASFSSKINRYDPTGGAKSAMRMTTEGFKPFHNGMAHPAYSEVGSADMRIAERVAAEKAAKTNEPQSVARAENIIRQIKGNRARMARKIDRENPNASRYARTYAKAMTGPKANIDAQFIKAYARNAEAGGAMRNDPRYSSKSVYVSPNGYAHTSQEIAKEIGESKHESYKKASPIGSRMDAVRGSMNRSIRKAKREVANTASKAYNTASKYASAAANKAKSAASSASKAASSVVASGKKTVDDILNKFKKKKK